MRERRRFEGDRGFVVCDTRHLPIVVLQWHGEIDAKQIAAFGQWMDEVLFGLEAEGLLAVTLVDLTHAERPSSEARRALVELRDRHERASGGRVVADVVVTNRPVLRGVMQTLNWINPRTASMSAATLDEGLRRCRDVLERAGVAAPLLRAEEIEE